MDATALRAMQAPIKEQYKAEPGAAMITLRAKGTLDDQNIACKVETGHALADAGLHPATGGSGLELCSGDMLLEALVACAGVTLKAVSTALEIPLKSGHVSAEGDLDFRGTLGRQGCARRFCADPPHLRCRHRRAAGEARSVAQTHRALLRRVSDHQARSAGGGEAAAGVAQAPPSSPCAALRWGGVRGGVPRDAPSSRHNIDPRPTVPSRGEGARAPCPPNMSPELAFLLSLALRMAIAAAFVVIASMITERSGPAIGALIATLPFSAGPLLHLPRHRPGRRLHRTERAREPADERRDRADVARIRLLVQR